MKTSSAGAILAAITKLISKKVDLRVKCKTKKSKNNKLLWWYVIHGAENDLIFLESEWEKIQNHTLWTLHKCLLTPKMPQPSTSVSPGATWAATPQSVTEHVKAESMQYTDRGISNNPTPVEQVPNYSSTIDATQPIDLSDNSSDSEQVLTPTPKFTDLSQLPSQHTADHAGDGQSSRAWLWVGSTFTNFIPPSSLSNNNLYIPHPHNILYFNARSLLSKVDELRPLCALEKPHCVCVVETWVSQDISDIE